MLQECFLSGGEKNEEQNAYNLGAKEFYLLDIRAPKAILAR